MPGIYPVYAILATAGRQRKTTVTPPAEAVGSRPENLENKQNGR
jgi:hypothetical protein